MIEAIGTDIVEICRIERAMRNPKFLERILTPTELNQPLTVERVAGRWAAKEAIAKCFAQRLSWHDVEIHVSLNGAPQAKLVKSDLLQPGWKIHISISHERTHAMAIAIIESES